METLKLFIELISLTLFSLLVISTSYMFIYSVLGLLYREKDKKVVLNNSLVPRVAIIIPAYKEDSVIVKTAESALRQNYPVGKSQVIVVADRLQSSTLYKLNHLPLKLIEVNFENSTKAKAINTALNSIGENFDMVVILDADNIIGSEFLGKISNAFINGHHAIQGHRTAKNINTGYSLLDAISEEINNHIFCKGQQYLGMSSRLTGSGMGFEFKLFRKLMSEINSVGGFDKELELKLISSDVKIHYVPSAIVFDEKVNRADVLTKQRTRWISSQIFYMKKYLPSGIIQLIKNQNIDYFNKSIQLIIPPRLITVLMIMIGLGLSVMISSQSLTNGWIVLSMFYVMSFVIAFPRNFIGRHLVKLLIVIPNTFIRFISSIPSLFSANQKFIHTPHES
jgi:cellulose synthase/poly-beta-1,6-N-acetylglucosamine synthase-like glycosyltransferase